MDFWLLRRSCPYPPPPTAEVGGLYFSMWPSLVFCPPLCCCRFSVYSGAPPTPEPFACQSGCSRIVFLEVWGLRPQTSYSDDMILRAGETLSGSSLQKIHFQVGRKLFFFLIKNSFHLCFWCLCHEDFFVLCCIISVAHGMSFEL